MVLQPQSEHPHGLDDQDFDVNIEKIQSRRGAPMAQQAGLDVFQLERRFEQRIVLQINLPDRQVIRRAPIGMHLHEEVGRLGRVHQGLLNRSLRGGCP